MLKLLIADPSEGVTDILAEIFRNDFDLRICHDGESALETLNAFQPDALLINLQLAYKDGLTVLQESAHRPKVILASVPYMNPYLEAKAIEVGIQYVQFSPTTQSQRVRLMDMITTTLTDKNDLEAQTRLHLHILNFRTHLDGYKQLRIAIPMYAADPRILLSKELYPRIADCCDLPDPRTVEHSMRKAIEDAWRHKKQATWAGYFPTKSDGTIPCPTNKTFLAGVADKLER